MNVPFFGPEITCVYALDPSLSLWRLGQERVRASRVEIQFVCGSGEAIPVDAGVIDSVLMTWTLCSIADPHAALREIGRVLKPAGRLVFIEHGLAPDPSVRRWQARLNPVRRRLAGGCNLDRPIDTLIRSAGFELTRLERSYGTGPRPLDYLYRGIAQPKL